MYSACGSVQVMSKPNIFIFDSYKAQGNKLFFSYAYNNGLQFTETLELERTIDTVDSAVLNNVLFALHIALGMSYWKVYAPQQIEIRSGQLNKEQADFWDTVYTKGLGEFFYVNQIDFRGLVQFPFSATVTESAPTMQTSGSIVPLGGGKDSLLTATLLQSATDTDLHTFETFSVNSYPIIDQQAQRLERTHISVKRTIDPALLALNTQADVYNGHVPISVIYGLCGVLQAVMSGRKYVVLSNEASSNEGNVEYLGEEINHQWSKSLEFERAFQEYVHKYITPSITYFSFLRPLSELLVVHMLSRFAADKLDMVTSCNRNFRIAGAGTQRWCGACSKDASTFALFAGVAQVNDVVGIFEGQNLFNSPALLDTYRELLGVQDFKPFDCVGTIDEMRVAFFRAQTHGFADTAAMNMFREEVLPQMELHTVERNALGATYREEAPVIEHQLMTLSSEHAMPAEACTLLNNAFGSWERQTNQ